MVDTDIVDHEDHFMISSDGVLRFKLPPDFETPAVDAWPTLPT